MHAWEIMAPASYDQNAWCNSIQALTDENRNSTAGSPLSDADNKSAISPDMIMHKNQQQISGGGGSDPQLVRGMIAQQSVFNPLTPPGYTGAVPSIIQSQQLHHHHHYSHTSLLGHHHQQNQQQQQQQQLLHPQPNQTTPPSRGSDFVKLEINYPVSSTLTPSHTPPIDITPPKSPKSVNATPTKVKELDQTSIDSADDTQSMGSEYDEDGIRTPKVNSHGKMKMFKCKQCEFVAVTKLSFWDHTKVHIKPEKMLKCLKCPFVTEYKHHLEYHLRNHDGSKPFQCPSCSYSCVNKSMLNSHLKSHSNVYQYRCTDCNYATKYCHSLKLHLRKYQHQPAMVLNQDGTPNPLPIIDVYGTRRGPKTKSSSKKRGGDGEHRKSVRSNNRELVKLAKSRCPPMPSNQYYQKHPNGASLLPSLMPNSFVNILQSRTNLGPALLPYLNLHMLAARQQQHQQQQQEQQQQQQHQHQQNHLVNLQLSPTMITARHNKRYGTMGSVIDSEDGGFDDLSEQSSTTPIDEDRDSPPPPPPPEEQDLMQLHMKHEPIQVDADDSRASMPDTATKSIGEHNNNHNNASLNLEPAIVVQLPTTPNTPSTSQLKSRRKGRAFKLEMFNEQSSPSAHSPKVSYPESVTSSSIAGEQPASVAATVAAVVTVEVPPTVVATVDTSPPSIKSYECKFCEISFKDAVLYTIHMGYHGYNDPWVCNSCGAKTSDRFAFFLHIARNSHS